MITRMKKLSFLIHSGEYEQFLEHLRSIGVVHVVQKQAGALQDEALQEDINLLARYKNALKVLEPLAANGDGSLWQVPDSETNSDLSICQKEPSPMAVLERFDILEAEKIVQDQTLQFLNRDRSQLLPWGDFDPAALERLAGVGYKIRLYTCPIRTYGRSCLTMWIS